MNHLWWSCRIFLHLESLAHQMLENFRRVGDGDAFIPSKIRALLRRTIRRRLLLEGEFVFQ